MNSAAAESLSCLTFFKKTALTISSDNLDTVFEEQGVRRLLQISPDHQQIYKTLIRRLKLRLLDATDSTVSIVVVANHWPKSDLEAPLLELKEQGVDLFFYEKGAQGPLPSIQPGPTVFIVKASSVEVLFTEMERLGQAGRRFALEGIYVEEKPSVRSSFSTYQLDRILENSEALLFGFATGTPAGLKKIFPHYDKAYAMGEILDFPQLTVTHTRLYSYEDAQQLAREQGIETLEQLKNWIKPNGVPTDLADAYRGRGWEGPEVFLGLRPKQPENIKTPGRRPLSRSFEEAKKIVRRQNFWMVKQYRGWPQRPKDIPLYPSTVYANAGWKGWEDYLGQSRWMTYDEAKKAVQEAGIKDWDAFRNWRNRPPRLPPTPNKIYPEWVSGSDFFNNQNIRIPPLLVRLRSYEEARELVMMIGIKSSTQYAKWNKPEWMQLPSEPDRYYRQKGWVSWASFLGTTQHEDD